MHDVAPPFGATRIDDPTEIEAVILAGQIVHALDGEPAEIAILALLLVLADLVVCSTPLATADDEDALVDTLTDHLHLCLARLRQLPPVE